MNEVTRFPKARQESFHSTPWHELSDSDFFESPELVVDFYAEALQNPSVIDDTVFFLDSGDMFDRVANLIRWNPETYKRIIAKRLDFNNTSKFARTGLLLNELPLLLSAIESDESESDYYDKDGNIQGDFSGSEALLETLENAVIEKKGSYLLYSRALFLLRDLKSTSFEDTEEGLHTIDEDLDQNAEYDSTQKSQDKDISFMLSKVMREHINTEFGISIDVLTDKEQLYFLSYLKLVPVPNADSMKHFTALYGVDGMRTFLSLEKGDETLGDHIVAFGQHEDVASTVFKYYGELLNQADQIEDEGVRERVLARAQKDLETAVRTHDPASIAERLHTYVAEAKVEVALIQEGIKKPLSATTTTGLSSDLPERMQAISARNYSKESPEFQELMREGMAAKFNEPNRRWYVDQTDTGEIIFFDSFTDVLDRETGEVQHKTFEAVNLGDDKYGGAGAARLKQTLDVELADGLPMQAFSDPENPVSQFYIEHGFVAVGTVSPAGKFSFELWRNSESSELLQTKQLSTPELIAQIESSEETSNLTIRAVENGDRFPELSDGQCITRYFKHNGQQYAIFEIVPAELQNGFVLPPEEQVLAA
jgi:hypothetical protein